MRRIITLALAFAPVVAHAQADQEKSRSVTGGGISVAGWQGKIDAREAGQGMTINDAKFAPMGKGMHITTGPATTYWNPANKVSGDYKVSATFDEAQYMNLNDHPHPYGIVIAGNDLGGANQHLYLGYRSLLASTLNDFVKGRARSLREVTVAEVLRAAGYVAEMDALEATIATSPKESLGEALVATMSDAWLDDCTISGPPAHVRDRLEAWAATGVQPIAVMSSTSGGQAKAIGELFAALYASQRAVRPKMMPNTANRTKPVRRERAVPRPTTRLAWKIESGRRRTEVSPACSTGTG